MKNLICKKHKNIYIIEINREKQFNSVNIDVLEELDDMLDQINNMTNINCVIITGTGNKSFIAGADIKNMINMGKSEALEFSSLGHGLTIKIENFNKPIIAAINGYALGGGCEIAMSCHIRYCSQNAIFGQPEVGLGLIAGFVFGSLSDIFGFRANFENNQEKYIEDQNSQIKQNTLASSLFSLTVL